MPERQSRHPDNDLIDKILANAFANLGERFAILHHPPSGVNGENSQDPAYDHNVLEVALWLRDSHQDNPASSIRVRFSLCQFRGTP